MTWGSVPGRTVPDDYDRREIADDWIEPLAALEALPKGWSVAQLVYTTEEDRWEQYA